MNFYGALNLNPNTFEARELKSNYRQLSLQYHPDKHLNLEPQERARQESMYFIIKKANEVLRDPLLRSVYDKMGPTALDCTRCKSERDFVMHGFSSFFSFYFGTGVILIIFTLLGKGEFGRYWRYVFLIFMGCIELITLFSNSDPIKYFFYWKISHEKIQILHQVFISVSIALSQIGPIFWPVEGTDNVAGLITEVENITNANLNEASGHFASSFEAVAKDPVAVGHMQRKMERMVVDLQLSEADPTLKERRRRR
ncbi:hypothetical protein HDV05_003641 [Chytridiales sp. JEL 0842]|nr:hypothetical protein HDV05_003641 [Chytridiales sp. JEL 0842]